MPLHSWRHSAEFLPYFSFSLMFSIISMPATASSSWVSRCTRWSLLVPSNLRYSMILSSKVPSFFLVCSVLSWSLQRPCVVLAVSQEWSYKGERLKNWSCILFPSYPLFLPGWLLGLSSSRCGQDSVVATHNYLILALLEKNKGWDLLPHEERLRDLGLFVLE